MLLERSGMLRQEDRKKRDTHTHVVSQGESVMLPGGLTCPAVIQCQHRDSNEQILILPLSDSSSYVCVWAPWLTASSSPSTMLGRNMSQKLSVLLIILGLAWGLMLLRYTMQQPHHQSSGELHQQILELSRRYVKVLTEENQNAPGGPQGTSMAGYADLKRTIAVLLDDILTRLVKLEGKMELVANISVTNSSHPAVGTLASAPVALHKATPGNHRLETPRIPPHTPNRPRPGV
ncbi:hypothetical protein J4Q44_G00064580 [Coregonus suidteri]|uniref:MGT5A-like N-terminal domain-containing protein n=2 Tax=Coregonus TaxID=27772 RepID=A0AAN8M6W1_9TELE